MIVALDDYKQSVLGLVQYVLTCYKPLTPADAGPGVVIHHLSGRCSNDLSEQVSVTGVLFLILDRGGTTTLIAEGRGSKYSFIHRRRSRKFAKGIEPTFLQG